MTVWNQITGLFRCCLPGRENLSCRNERFTGMWHLFVLWAFAVAQPIYDRVGERPAFLIDMHVGTAALLWLTFLVSLLIPAILVLILVGVQRYFRVAGDVLHTVLVYLLFVVGIAPVVKRFNGLTAELIIGGAALLATLVVWSYFRFSRFRSVVTVAGPVVLIFPLLFLFNSPVGHRYFYTQSSIDADNWRPVPVVFVVLDEFCGMSLRTPTNEIDAQRFPNFAELARCSHWYRNATTVYPDTWQAVPALLSGKIPSAGWAPTEVDRPQNLLSVLCIGGGYDAAVFEPVTRIAPTPAVLATPPESTSFHQLASILPTLSRVMLFHISPETLYEHLPKIPKLWFGFHEVSKIDRSSHRGLFRYATGDDRLEQIDHFLDCLDNSQAASLYFIHTLLPHVPWCYLPNGRKYIAESAGFEVLHDDLLVDPFFTEQCEQRYLLQLEFVDAQLGRLLARLRETDLFDDCLLVVMADHGVCFQTGEPRRTATDRNLPDILSIPLFIKTPGQTTGIIDDRNVESIDVFPTVADVLGVKIQLPVDGVSLLNAKTREREFKHWKDQSVLPNKPYSAPASLLKQSTVVERIRQRFGSSDDLAGLFRIGPCPALLGKNVGEIPQNALEKPVVELRRGGTRYLPKSAEIVPCFFDGDVRSPEPSGEATRLAIAVNGKICATTRTYELRQFQSRFTALIPESSLREGENEIQFFRIQGAAPNFELTPCEVRNLPADESSKN